MSYGPLQIRMAVTQGAELLDERKPDWWKHVNSSRLNQDSLHNCVLGQNYRHFDTGMTTLFGVGYAVGGTNVATEYGFDLPGSNDKATEAWKKEVQKRNMLDGQNTTSLDSIPVAVPTPTSLPVDIKVVLPMGEVTIPSGTPFDYIVKFVEANK
jgi:hypothetical protein